MEPPQCGGDENHFPKSEGCRFNPYWRQLQNADYQDGT